MQVNQNVYPPDDSLTNENVTITTTTLNDFPVDTAIENSIIYSTTTGGYGDNETKWIYTFTGITNRPPSYIQSDLMVNNYNSYIMNYVRGVTPYNFFNAGNGNYTNGAKNTNKSSNVDAQPQYSNSIGYVTGFKYHTIVGCIRIISSTGDTSGTLRDSDYDTYFNSYSNEKIVCVYVELWNGNERSRISKQIQFSRYNQYNVVSKVLGNPHDQYERTTTETDPTPRDYPIDPTSSTAKGNYSISSMPVYNYFPTGSAGNGRRGLVVFGAECVGIAQLRTDLRGNYTTYSDAPGYPFRSSNLADWETVLPLKPNSSLYDSGNNSYYYPKVDLTAEDILHLAATLGIIFTTKENHARNSDLTFESDTSEEILNAGVFSDDTYFPKKTNDYWQGAYTHGKDNANAEQIKDNWNSDKNAPFTQGSGMPKEDSGDEKDGIDEDSLASTSASTFTRQYALTPSELKTVADYLNTSNEGLLETLNKYFLLGGSNPIENIVSLLYVPVSIGWLEHQGILTTSDVHIGAVAIPKTYSTTEFETLSCHQLSQTNIYVDIGSTYISKKHENYMDYSPYTNYIAYIPYCGWTDLDADVITGKYVHARLFLELNTGSCTVVLRVGAVNDYDSCRMYKTINGQMGAVSPITTTDYSGYASSILNSAGNAATGLIGAVAVGVGAAALPEAAVGLAVAGASVSALGGTAKMLADWSLTKPSFNSTGTPTGSNNGMMSSYLTIYRYTVHDLDSTETDGFITANGRACAMYKQLSLLSGYTECGNVNLGGISGATNPELSEIKQMLENGVYIT